MSLPDTPAEQSSGRKVMSWLRIVGIGIAVLAAVVVALFIEYHLPSTVVAQVTNTEVRRIDRENPDSGVMESRDVFFISARTRDDRYIEFRNEDDWLYGKINSARVQNIASDNEIDAEANPDTAGQRKWFLIQYYGWRMTWFSAYPNIIDIDEVERDYSHVPILNIIILVVLFGGVGYVLFLIWRWRKRRRHARLTDSSPGSHSE